MKKYKISGKTICTIEPVGDKFILTYYCGSRVAKWNMDSFDHADKFAKEFVEEMRWANGW